MLGSGTLGYRTHPPAYLGTYLPREQTGDSVLRFYLINAFEDGFIWKQPDPTDTGKVPTKPAIESKQQRHTEAPLTEVKAPLLLTEVLTTFASVKALSSKLCSPFVREPPLPGWPPQRLRQSDLPSLRLNSA